MSSSALSLEATTIHIEQEIEVRASIEVTFAAIVVKPRAFAANKNDVRARGDVHQRIERMDSHGHGRTPAFGMGGDGHKCEKAATFWAAAFSKTLLI